MVISPVFADGAEVFALLLLLLLLLALLLRDYEEKSVNMIFYDKNGR